MKKEDFYMTGFYCLIGLIIGFTIGSLLTEHSIKVQCTINNIANLDSDTVKMVSYNRPPLKVSDSVLLSNLKFHGIKHPDIVLAQAKLETGNYTSSIYKKNKNLFGLMKGNKYHSFKHWEDSVIFYKEHVQSRYGGGDYFAFLDNINYAEDKKYIAKVKQITKALTL